MVQRPVVHVHADESCLGNQFRGRDNPGGAAGLVESCRAGLWERRDYWVSGPATTNNRMALRSAIEVLSRLNRSCRVTLISDSQYLVRGMDEWVSRWKAQGWKRKGGRIENLELWQALVTAATLHDVTWAWVRGHAGHPKNEYAHHLATGAARRQDASSALVPSGFERWLEEERVRGRYLDFQELLPPEEE